MTSQQTMVNWAKDNVYKWIDMDGMYGAQCKCQYKNVQK